MLCAEISLCLRFMQGQLKHFDVGTTGYKRYRLEPAMGTHRIFSGMAGTREQGECEARAYNGGLWAEDLAGSRGRAPGQRGKAR